MPVIMFKWTISSNLELHRFRKNVKSVNKSSHFCIRKFNYNSKKSWNIWNVDFLVKPITNAFSKQMFYETTKQSHSWSVFNCVYFYSNLNALNFLWRTEAIARFFLIHEIILHNSNVFFWNSVQLFSYNFDEWLLGYECLKTKFKK